MAKRSKDKGAEGERELCALLTDAYGFKVKRKLGQARDSGADVPLDPFLIEVKRRANFRTLYRWMGQAISAARASAVRPVLAVRADGQDWLIVLLLDDFILLAREEVAAKITEELDGVPC